MKPRKPYIELFGYGIGSASLYLLLYLHETEIMAAFTRTDGLYPALPIVAAFVFSIVHGAFTSYFWEVLGVRAAKKS